MLFVSTKMTAVFTIKYDSITSNKNDTEHMHAYKNSLDSAKMNRTNGNLERLVGFSFVSKKK